MNFFEERSELTTLIKVAKEIIEKDYKPDGYNIGMKATCWTNCDAFPLSSNSKVLGLDMEYPRGLLDTVLKTRVIIKYED